MRGGKWAALSSPLPLMHPVWLARGWVERAARLAGRQAGKREMLSMLHLRDITALPGQRTGQVRGRGGVRGRGLNPNFCWEVVVGWGYPTSKKSVRTVLALGPSRKWETASRKHWRPCWLGAQTGPDVWLHDTCYCK